jgi:protein disulfide-isomerase A6
MQGVKYQGSSFLCPTPHAITLIPLLSTGLNKFDSLSTFFDSVLDGTADLSVVNTKLSEEEYTQTEEEKEIEMKQEAQRIALAHGGFSNLIDFEAAVKAGAGKNFHDSHGFGMMGEMPFKKKAEGASGEAASGADASKAEDTASEAEPTPSPDAEEKVEEQEETQKQAESPSVTVTPSQSDAEAVTDSVEGQETFKAPEMTTVPTRDEL